MFFAIEKGICHLCRMQTFVRWYEIAKDAARLSDDQMKRVFGAIGGKKVPRSKICTLRKLARIHPSIGSVMDEVGTPWRTVIYIVHANGPAAQRERATTALAELVARREAAGEPSALAKELIAAIGESKAEAVKAVHASLG